MSSKLERDIQAYLFFDGPMPDLSMGMKSVPFPVTGRPIPAKTHSRTYKVLVRILDEPEDDPAFGVEIGQGDPF